MKPATIRITIPKASSIGKVHPPHLIIKTEGQMPEFNGDDWAPRMAAHYNKLGETLAAAIFASFSGGVIDALIAAMLKRRASLFRVRF